jgi:hypothetical protein
MKKILDWFSDNAWLFYLGAFLVALYVTVNHGYLNGKQNEALKDYKDGIQNHLTWNIKGECFFVRPNDDVTVYLIRVADCDKK